MITAPYEAPQGASTPIIAITVLLNVAVDDSGRGLNWDGYEPGHDLRNVGDIRVTLHDDIQATLDEAYVALNVGNGTDEVGTYRARRNRSLSVGDVLVVDGVAYAVSDLGFTLTRVPVASVSRLGRGRGATGVDEAL